MNKIHITSEIGRLKKVLLHRPGDELENLSPRLLKKLLFDDIPFLELAKTEHDVFAKVLKDEAVDVLYITDLVVKTLEQNKNVVDGHVEKPLKEKFINQFIKEAQVLHPKRAYDYFNAMSTEEMVHKMIAGVRVQEMQFKGLKSLSQFMPDEYLFVTEPLPNLLYQRDLATSVGEGMTINKMYTATRRRETLFLHYIFTYHEEYKNNSNFYYNRKDLFSLEGGDILVLNKNTLIIGLSERTHPDAIQILAQRVFFENNTEFNKILVLNIPKTRAFMHLDTVFTQVDYNKFVIQSGILKNLEVFELVKIDKKVEITQNKAPLQHIFSSRLENDVQFIMCGDDDPVDSSREQWGSATNTLCIRPGVVIVYSRNCLTNACLEKAGIKTIEIPSSELSRGRGGPRCMTMVLQRENI